MTELEYFKGDELAASTWRNKYAADGEQTPDDTHRRLAKEFARVESNYNWKSNINRAFSNLSNYGYVRPQLDEEAIYQLFKDFKYIIPGGSVMSGCGTGALVSLSNCFVIGSPKDSYSEIMKTRSQQAQLMKRRGGVGYDLSQLRPRGAKVNNAAKSSTGAASFMDVCSDITNEVAQNGRRGALMLSMSINHPDIEEFITKKQDLTKVTGANISVKVTDEFMQAVMEDKDYILRYPVTISNEDLFGMDLTVEEVLNSSKYNELERGFSCNSYYKKIKARELWNTLMHCAWNTAEPGIMFEGAMHNYSPDGVYPDFKMVSTNPCGEIPMGPFDSCRLIHINLSSYIVDPFTDKAHIDEELLYMHSYEAMRLADDLVDLEIEAVDRIIDTVKNDTDDTEFKLWSKIKETAIRGRRAGLGFTGLADAIAMLGLKYDSDEGISQVEQLMKVMFKGQLDSNIDMAIERGPFPVWNVRQEFHAGWDDGGSGQNDWFTILCKDYNSEARRMFQYGRRNISWSTVAPTGTVSIMAGTSSGIEPIFLPFYQRKRKCMSESDRVDYVDKVGEKYTLFTVVHPNLKRWAIETMNYSESEVNEWSLGVWKEVWKESPYYGSTAPEIDWRQRVKLQGVVQKYITHSISSTVNLAKETTEEEIADIYIEAWKQGLKGITIYRDGCREGVLTQVEKPKTIEGRQAPKRPKELEADAYLIKAKGEQFIILVGMLESKPYEVFAFRPRNPISFKPHKGIITKVSKMHYSFTSDVFHIDNLELANTNIEENAATLYSSMLLRHGVSIEYIIKTAKKVNDNISSFSSAMCRILAKYISNEEIKGEVCPDCGSVLIRENGCVHCSSCGWSRCG
ncbi:vitamin B12-dependent ribonucleotide reductase [Bacteroides phage PhiCrAssBcn5]|nr:vitamin B12-dependent ribonucleotide reductase [Bacteroides phage PhiCrAssBcn4]WCF57672.1 vitamin B12-dependent ribonucleotide reductase [Bacteroides phage PhiCrAssBcn5]WCF57835.1 vitamin B12-dependent ribonucleotide reductase [Bacteroides phage PhiCrAssBcn6]WCF57959.1 vitamin B12-dependent ribonucleotide reductase [Bacteroides phage PhiCrAssBcn7]WCF57969.1 vitamin B12-dependent ribonucleotide reductase [Bacteroides phage PhiCrAssBcn8]